MHCLGLDYFHATQSGLATVIDNHFTASDSPLPDSGCAGNEHVSFFKLAQGTTLMFLHCKIENIRVRAEAFVKLQGGEVLFH